MNSQEFDISGMKVLLAIPMYDGKIHAKCLQGIFEAVQLSYKHDFVLELTYVKGSSLIQVARNELTGLFLEKNVHDKIFWIDSDIGFRGEDLIRILALSTVYPIVGAMYPLKNPKITFKAMPKQEDGKYVFNKYGMISMVSMPLGFSVIDKKIFTRLIDWGALQFTREAGNPLYEFFRVYVNNGLVWGEDVDFCHQVLNLGEEVWCDPSIRLVHIGDQEYEGNYLESLK